MTNYRRSWIAGATYFFTVNLAERSRSLLLDHMMISRRSLQQWDEVAKARSRAAT